MNDTVYEATITSKRDGRIVLTETVRDSDHGALRRKAMKRAGLAFYSHDATEADIKVPIDDGKGGTVTLLTTVTMGPAPTQETA